MQRKCAERVLAPDVVRVEVSGPDSAVFRAATGSSSSPIRDDLPMANAGAWRATLVALETPVGADDRIDFRA
jgi:hypothetical protein